MSLPLNLIGKRFGRLLVTSRGPNTEDGNTQWNCKCDCGKETIQRAKDIKSGKSQSCGCLKKELLIKKLVKVIPTGTRFGLLTVMGMEPHQKPHSKCRVKCDCGREFIVRTNSLMSGSTSGCGNDCPCRSPDAARNRVLKNYKANAKARGLRWDLSEEKFFDLTLQPCFYCGRELSNTEIPRTEGKEIYRYNGVDRMDNSIGYEESNCVSCCRQCNKAKMDRTVEEFVAWGHQLSDHLKTKGL